jgi:hypothetical protein
MTAALDARKTMILREPSRRLVEVGDGEDDVVELERYVRS